MANVNAQPASRERIEALERENVEKSRLLGQKALMVEDYQRQLSSKQAEVRAKEESIDDVDYYKSSEEEVHDAQELEQLNREALELRQVIQQLSDEVQQLAKEVLHAREKLQIEKEKGAKSAESAPQPAPEPKAEAQVSTAEENEAAAAPDPEAEVAAAQTRNEALDKTETVGNDAEQGKSLESQAAGGTLDDMNPKQEVRTNGATEAVVSAPRVETASEPEAKTEMVDETVVGPATAEAEAADAESMLTRMGWPKLMRMYNAVEHVNMDGFDRNDLLRGAYWKERQDLMAKGMGSMQADMMFMRKHNLGGAAMKILREGVEDAEDEAHYINQAENYAAEALTAEADLAEMKTYNERMDLKHKYDEKIAYWQDQYEHFAQEEEALQEKMQGLQPDSAEAKAIREKLQKIIPLVNRTNEVRNQMVFGASLVDEAVFAMRKEAPEAGDLSDRSEDTVQVENPERAAKVERVAKRVSKREGFRRAKASVLAALAALTLSAGVARGLETTANAGEQVPVEDTGGSDVGGGSVNLSAQYNVTSESTGDETSEDGFKVERNVDGGETFANGMRGNYADNWGAPVAEDHVATREMKGSRNSFNVSFEYLYDNQDDNETAQTLYDEAGAQWETGAAIYACCPNLLQKVGAMNGIDLMRFVNDGIGLDDFVSNSEIGGKLQADFNNAFADMLESDNLDILYSLANGVVETQYVMNNMSADGVMNPQTMRLAFDEKERVNDPQIELRYTDVDNLDENGNPRVYSVFLNLRCGFQPNFFKEVAPTPAPVVRKRQTPKPKPVPGTTVVEEQADPEPELPPDLMKDEEPEPELPPEITPDDEPEPELPEDETTDEDLPDDSSDTDEEDDDDDDDKDKDDDNHDDDDKKDDDDDKKDDDNDKKDDDDDKKDDDDDKKDDDDDKKDDDDDKKDDDDDKKDDDDDKKDDDDDNKKDDDDKKDNVIIKDSQNQKDKVDLGDQTNPVNKTDDATQTGDGLTDRPVWNTDDKNNKNDNNDNKNDHTDQQKPGQTISGETNTTETDDKKDNTAETDDKKDNTTSGITGSIPDNMVEDSTASDDQKQQNHKDQQDANKNEQQQNPDGTNANLSDDQYEDYIDQVVAQLGGSDLGAGTGSEA